MREAASQEWFLGGARSRKGGPRLPLPKIRGLWCCAPSLLRISSNFLPLRAQSFIHIRSLLYTPPAHCCCAYLTGCYSNLPCSLPLGRLTNSYIEPILLDFILIAAMIRRNPTLIGMSDSDVQDIRDLTRRRKEAAQPAASSRPLIPGMLVDPAKPLVAPEDARRKREAMTRDERLGL